MKWLLGCTTALAVLLVAGTLSWSGTADTTSNIAVPQNAAAVAGDLQGVSLATDRVQMASLSFAPSMALQKSSLFGSGLNLTRRDVELQRQTVGRCLEVEPDGKISSWKNPKTGHSGRVQATNTYEKKGLMCRDFKLEINGAETVRLALSACKQDDGAWKLHL